MTYDEIIENIDYFEISNSASFEDACIKFARAIAAKEREECAKLCETEYAKNDGVSCAEAIRAKSE